MDPRVGLSGVPKQGFKPRLRDLSARLCAALPSGAGAWRLQVRKGPGSVSQQHRQLSCPFAPGSHPYPPTPSKALDIGVWEMLLQACGSRMDPLAPELASGRPGFI